MRRELRYIPLSMLFLVVIVGAVHAWAARHSMNPDGIAYLEMGEAYLRGDWGRALNAYWSPVYAVILASVNRVIAPTAYWEFTVIHGINFVIYLFAFFAFLYMLSGLLRLADDSMGEHKKAFITFAISLFLVTSLNLITLAVVTPDLLLSAFLYLACGLLLRMKKSQYGLVIPITLGVVLGLGYLIKAPLFLISLLFIVVVYGVSRNIKKTALVAFFFLAVAIPFLLILSGKAGHLTFGDSGWLNFVWYTNDVKEHIHWQGGGPNGDPIHPTRRIYKSPDVFEFREPISATYAPWYDPVYWNEGLVGRFNLRGIMTNMLRNAKEYYFLFFTYYNSVLAGLAVLFFMSERRKDFILNTILVSWPVLVVSLSGIGMYFVGVVRDRYTAPFILLFLLILVFGASVSISTRTREVKGVLRAMTCILFVVLVGSSLGDVVRASRVDDTSEHIQWRVASELNKHGVVAGSEVAYIGHTFNGLAAYWAYIGRMRIVAEIPTGEDAYFWGADSGLQENVLSILRKTGAEAVIAESLPANRAFHGWEQLGDTGYFVYKLYSL